MPAGRADWLPPGREYGGSLAVGPCGIHGAMVFRLAAVLVFCMPIVGGAAPPLAESGRTLLEGLSPEQRGDLTWAFADAERMDVHFAPFFLDGVALGDLSPTSRIDAEGLVARVLSRRGVESVRTVRELERAVRHKEAKRFWSFATRRYRDPARYLLALFGDPSVRAPWGFRFEGHHLSLNVTAMPGAVPAVTPLFLGAEPRLVPDGAPLAGTALLGEEERLARRLHAGLADGLRERATLSYDEGRALLLGDVARGALPEGLGLTRGDMPPERRAELDALLERFLGLFAEPIAAAYRERIEAAGRDRLRFAFTAADEPEHAFYARVEGPTLLLEIDNTTDGDHVHAVLHDLEHDFGGDALARHLREQHGVGPQQVASESPPATPYP